MVIQFEDMLFPILEMRTNIKHDAQGEKSGTELLVDQNLQKLPGEGSRYGLGVSVGSNNQVSVNPPYAFLIEAYAIIRVSESTLSAEDEARQVLTNGVSIIVGAIRERLAEMTSRGPWGRFLINPTPLPSPVQTAFI